MTRSAKKTPVMITTFGGKTMTAAEWMLRNKRKAVTIEQVNTPPTPTLKADPALQTRDIEAVFDALVLGGCPRGKTWVMNFLKASGHRHERGAMLSNTDVTQAL